jgi:uncharacterized protein
VDEATRRLTELIAADRSAMAILRAVRRLDLNDWAIGAGFVRNRVWDAVSRHDTPTVPGDTDVLYFDAADLRPETETMLEQRLCAVMPDVPPWSVTNQARMHLENGDRPYASTADALWFWLETPTCVAVRLEPDETVTVLAPHGLGDLFGLRVRPTPNGRDKLEAYRARIRAKNWPARWPRVKIEL